MSKGMSVSQAREFVLAEGELPEASSLDLRPEVLLSWRRSLMSGARIDSPELPFVGPGDTSTQLCLAAEPVLGRLADRLSGLGAGVLLADRNARILKRWVADRGILPMLDRLRSDAGFTVSEEIVGTNGVGTVAETGRPIQIVGPEHLAECMVQFACVGVPVHHPITHRLEGIITMSSRAEAGSALLTPLMMSAALDVEHRLLEQASVRERIVLDAYLDASKGGIRRVAGVGQDILIAGPRVTQLLDGTSQVVLWEVVREALGTSAEASATVTLDNGNILPIVCRPIHGPESVVGALVDFGSPMQSAAPAAPSAREVHDNQTFAGLPGGSRAWAESVSTIRRAVRRPEPVLVTGEAGVGKASLVRAALLEQGWNKSAIAVLDCARLSWQDAESAIEELARARASGARAVILRHIESIDSSRAIAALASEVAAWQEDSDAPHIIATFVSATGEAGSAEFQRLMDLIGVQRLHIAPLRERIEDIRPIALAVLQKQGKGGISTGAMRALTRAPWPGNATQLKAVLSNAAATITGEMQVEHLPAEIQACATRRQLTTLEQVELRAILDALQQARGNKVLAARIVGVSRSTLYRKLSSYRIDPDAQFF